MLFGGWKILRNPALNMVFASASCALYRPGRGSVSRGSVPIPCNLGGILVTESRIKDRLLQQAQGELSPT
jgi:hypothetical protein